MSRVEQYKNLRVHKRKCVFAGFLFVIIVFTGVIGADYSVNTVLKNENKVEIIGMVMQPDNSMQMNIMDQKVNIRLDRIYQDFNNVKKTILDLIPK